MNPDLPGRVHLEDDFVGTDTVFGLEDPELMKAFKKGELKALNIRLGFGSIVSGGVRMGEQLIHFTEKRGPGPENDKIGGALQRPDMMMRHIISKTKSAAEDPLVVDQLMEAKIRQGLEQAREELTLVEAGKTRHPTLYYKLHTKEQLEEGIDIFEQNLDGRWRMENHRFVSGFWLYGGDGRYSWHREKEEGVQEAASGGEITFATNIGKERDGQEDRVLIHLMSLPDVPNGVGDLLLLADGHGNEEAADFVGRKAPSLFEKALREKGGKIQEAQKAVFKALDDLMKDMGPGTTLSMVYLPKDERKAYPAWIGDSPIIIVREDSTLFMSREHNAAFDEEEKNAAISRGAFYDQSTRRISRGDGDPISMLPTRSLGDRRLRTLFSQEPEIPDPIPLGEESAVLLASDGLVQDVRGEGAGRVRELVQWMRLGFPAQLMVHRRLMEEDVADNVSAVIYLPKMTPRSSVEIADYFSVYGVRQPGKTVRDGANRDLLPRERSPERQSRDGAERYVAKDRGWLEAHEPFHKSPFSAEFQEASQALRQKGEVVVQIFHSAILREDLAESFSLALDHLAEETKNPLDNEKSTFRNVLLVDDPAVSFLADPYLPSSEQGRIFEEKKKAYLAKFSLRPEQFYAVITHDMLEGYEQFVNGKELRRNRDNPSVLYRLKVEAFLRFHLEQERLSFRLEKNSNVVIVASDIRPNPRIPSQAEAWKDYLWGKRYTIGLENLRAKVVIYEGRGKTEKFLNLAPILVRTAAEFAATKNPSASLENLKALLTIFNDPGGLRKIYVDPAPVTPEYQKAYATYLNSV